MLLFTEDIYQATRAQEAGDFDRIDLEVALSLEGAGLSLIDNDNRQEIAYLGVTRYAFQTCNGYLWNLANLSCSITLFFYIFN